MVINAESVTGETSSNPCLVGSIHFGSNALGKDIK